MLIVTDRHRADHVGFGGNPVVQTPHLDALAATGMRFEWAYVANPVCMPNRARVLTGRMPSVHGTRVNGIPLDWDAETFPRCLRRSGYRTAVIGKVHLQNLGHGEAEARQAAGGHHRPAVSRHRPDGSVGTDGRTGSDIATRPSNSRLTTTGSTTWTSCLTQHQDLTDACAAYEGIRRPRTDRVQRESHANRWLKDRFEPGWLYGYDVVKDLTAPAGQQPPHP